MKDYKSGSLLHNSDYILCHGLGSYGFIVTRHLCTRIPGCASVLGALHQHMSRTTTESDGLVIDFQNLDKTTLYGQEVFDSLE